MVSGKILLLLVKLVMPEPRVTTQDPVDAMPSNAPTAMTASMATVSLNPLPVTMLSVVPYNNVLEEHASPL